MKCAGRALRHNWVQKSCLREHETRRGHRLAAGSAENSGTAIIDGKVVPSLGRFKEVLKNMRANRFSAKSQDLVTWCSVLFLGSKKMKEDSKYCNYPYSNQG